MNDLFKHPVWAMAFRPFYSLAALYGALSILLWGFGYQGTPELPGFYWHAHEMIWGYAGLVVIAFLLTAVATWTGQPPTRGKALAGLTAFWLLARLCAFIPGWGATASGIFGTIFFLVWRGMHGFAGNPFSKQAQLCCRICYFCFGRHPFRVPYENAAV